MFGEKSSRCIFEKKEKGPEGSSLLVRRKVPLGANKRTVRTFLPGLSSCTVRTSLVFWPALLHTIDTDGRALHNDSESKPNEKIMKKPTGLFSKSLQNRCHDLG